MNAFFNNNWVVSLGTTLIGSIFIYIIQRLLEFARKNKDLKTANSKITKIILNALISLDLEKIQLSYVTSVVESLYRQYHIPSSRRKSTVQVINDTIIEITQLQYITTDAKTQIIDHAFLLKNKYDEQIIKDTTTSAVSKKQKNSFPSSPHLYVYIYRLSTCGLFFS